MDGGRGTRSKGGRRRVRREHVIHDSDGRMKHNERAMFYMYLLLFLNANNPQAFATSKVIFSPSLNTHVNCIDLFRKVATEVGGCCGNVATNCTRVVQNNRSM